MQLVTFWPSFNLFDGHLVVISQSNFHAILPFLDIFRGAESPKEGIPPFDFPRSRV